MSYTPLTDIIDLWHGIYLKGLQNY